MANKIFMNLNNYSTISERLYPGALTDPDYALWQEENADHVLVNQFELPTCEKKYWKRNTGTPPIVEMTQAEKNIVDANELEATNTAIRNMGKSNFDGFASMALSLKGLLSELILWLNKLNKSHKGYVGIENGNTAQSLTAGEWTLINQFNTSEGYNGTTTGQVTADKANNKITCSKSGSYMVFVNVCATGATGATFRVGLYNNGTLSAQTLLQIDASGSIESSCIFDIITVGSDNVDLTLRVKNTESTSKNFKIKQCQFVVFRHDDISDKILTDIISNIKSTIDAGGVD